MAVICLPKPSRLHRAFSVSGRKKWKLNKHYQIFCFFSPVFCLFKRQGGSRWILVFSYKAFTETDVHSNSWVHLQSCSLKCSLNEFLKTVIYCLPSLLLYFTTKDAYLHLMTWVSLLKGDCTFSNSVITTERKRERIITDMSFNNCYGLDLLYVLQTKTSSYSWKLWIANIVLKEMRAASGVIPFYLVNLLSYVM